MSFPNPRKLHIKTFLFYIIVCKREISKKQKGMKKNACNMYYYCCPYVSDKEVMIQYLMQKWNSKYFIWCWNRSVKCLEILDIHLANVSNSIRKCNKWTFSVNVVSLLSFENISIDACSITRILPFYILANAYCV